MKRFSEWKGLFLYLLVGIGATAAEWIVFYFMDAQWKIHYSLATAVAFAISTFVNWWLGRLLLFSKTESGLWKELIAVYSASIIGLVLNLLIMWVVIQWFHIPEMYAKMLATGIVFFWNYLIRKLVIYKKSGEEHEKT